MKTQLRGIIAGILIGMTLMSGTAFARTGRQMIEAAYNNIKIYIDGAIISPKDAAGKTVEPFIYNGTTYLPVRAIGEAFGKKVTWNGSTQSVYIGTAPGQVNYLTDVCPAYHSSASDSYNPRFFEYSSIQSGGTESFSVSGVKYTNGMTFGASLDSSEIGQWAVYNLNSSYTNLSFKVGHVDDTSNTHGDTKLMVYYDGVLHKEIPLSPDMYAKSVSLNVKGVNQLKLQVYARGYFHDWYGICDPVLK